MNFLYQAIFGLVVGVIAKMLMPGKDPGGCIITMLIGIAGSMLFGYLARNFLPPQFADWHWIGAILGAMGLLGIYHLVFGPTK